MCHLSNQRVARIALGLVLAFAAGTAAASTDRSELHSGADRSGNEFVSFQPARLIETTRPGFPRSGNRPKLVHYPGMPSAEQPGKDWAPEHGLWTLPVRVQVDARGEAVAARIGDHPLRSAGMVRRYERLALRAVNAWRFAPARVDGEPVASAGEEPRQACARASSDSGKLNSF